MGVPKTIGGGKRLGGKKTKTAKKAKKTAKKPAKKPAKRKAK